MRSIVVGEDGQFPVSDALIFVTDDRLPAACRSLFQLVHQQDIASSALTRPIISPVSSLAKEITIRVRKVACVCKIQGRTCSLRVSRPLALCYGKRFN